MPSLVLTIGTSDTPWTDFLSHLDQYSVGCVIDVRPFPRSRRPCFNQAPLRTGLNRRGIAYLHLGDQLGGNVVDQAASYNHRIKLPDFLDGIGERLCCTNRVTDRVSLSADRLTPRLLLRECRAP